MNSYKYSIKQQMEELPIVDYKKIKKLIPVAIGKTPRTFERYCNIKAEDFADIPTQDLDIIASILSSKADDLKNYVIHKQQIQHKIIRRR